MERLVLFLKGFCMGIADVIPGVSGGTLALILGVYAELVDTIRNLNLRWLPALLAWLKDRSEANRATLLDRIGTLNLPFLVTLGAGIAVALGVGSVVVPYFLENFPVQTRAFFFGLILASVWVPFRMIDFGGSRSVAVVAVTALIGLGIGWFVTNPGTTLDLTREQYQVTSEGESLKDLARKGPSALPNADVFWADENEALRLAIQDREPERYAELAALEERASAAVDKDAMKARSAPYDELVVPAGTVVSVPRPTWWFVLFAGMIAICAMILPGISGSYILLILGAYFFILNALKGFLGTLASGAFPANQALYVTVFCIGCAVGILSFARLLSYLLHNWAVPTLGLLVGLMVGCLRGIWPFRMTIDGVVTNVMPTAAHPLTGTIATFVLGLVIVGTFTWFGRERVDEAEAEI